MVRSRTLDILGMLTCALAFSTSACNPGDSEISEHDALTLQPSATTQPTPSNGRAIRAEIVEMNLPPPWSSEEATQIVVCAVKETGETGEVAAPAGPVSLRLTLDAEQTYLQTDLGSEDVHRATMNEESWVFEPTSDFKPECWRYPLVFDFSEVDTAPDATIARTQIIATLDQDGEQVDEVVAEFHRDARPDFTAEILSAPNQLTRRPGGHLIRAKICNQGAPATGPVTVALGLSNTPRSTDVGNDDSSNDGGNNDGGNNDDGANSGPNAQMIVIDQQELYFEDTEEGRCKRVDFLAYDAVRPGQRQPGEADWRIVVRADPDNDFIEHSESNNADSRVIGAREDPDLLITRFDLPSNILGPSIVADIEVCNRGYGESWPSRVVLTMQTEDPAAPSVLVGEASIDGLAYQHCRRFPISIAPWLVPTSGRIEVVATVDADNSNNESIEGNNQQTRVAYVRALVDLYVASFDIERHPAPEYQIAHLTICNQGNAPHIGPTIIDLYVRTSRKDRPTSILLDRAASFPEYPGVYSIGAGACASVSVPFQQPSATSWLDAIFLGGRDVTVEVLPVEHETNTENNRATATALFGGAPDLVPGRPEIVYAGLDEIRVRADVCNLGGPHPSETVALVSSNEILTPPVSRAALQQAGAQWEEFDFSYYAYDPTETEELAPGCHRYVSSLPSPTGFEFISMVVLEDTERAPYSCFADWLRDGQTCLFDEIPENNVSPALRLHEAPDLEVRDARLLPSSNGDSIAVATICNHFDPPGDPTRYRFAVTAAALDEVPVEDWPLLTEEHVIAEDEFPPFAYGCFEVSAPYTADSATSEWPAFLSVIVDPEDLAAEFDELNNAISLPL